MLNILRHLAKASVRHGLNTRVRVSAERGAHVKSVPPVSGVKYSALCFSFFILEVRVSSLRRRAFGLTVRRSVTVFVSNLAFPVPSRTYNVYSCDDLSLVAVCDGV